MKLKLGDRIPDFTAAMTSGALFHSQNVVGKKPVVIYFYPKNNTSICTAQACSFRDQYQDFKDLGAEVIGVSSDNLQSHQDFSNEYRLPFILLSDEKQELKKLFGVPNALFGLLPGRVTYVADEDGKIVMIFNSLLGAKHITKALEVLKKRK
ncbi:MULTISPECIES: peroxiredoxin [unclassified Flavobacterium]|uniref:peroxiredoxin n=1 Tax=unclassified Flavobacterium TaxID=196869 RepID=UPI003F8F21BB